LSVEVPASTSWENCPTSKGWTFLHILGKSSSLSRQDLSGSEALNDLSEEEYAPMKIGELSALEYMDFSYCTGLNAL
jgi:hypothetical protein